MVWGPTAFEVPHRPSRTGQSGWNESLPAGNMQVKSSARIFRDDTLNVTDLQSVCHWIVTLGIIRAVQKLFRGGAVPSHSLRHADKMAGSYRWAQRVSGVNSIDDLEVWRSFQPAMQFHFSCTVQMLKPLRNWRRANPDFL